MGFFDIFKKSSDDSDLNVLYFHEDDYRQTEIVSINALQTLEKECEKVYGFAKEHFDGKGFSEIYSRSHIGTDLDEYNIKCDELDALLKQLGVPKADKVKTGYSSYSETKKDVIGYGENYCAIYFEDFNGVVGNIWLTHFAFLDSDKVEDVLFQIGVKWNLILMDWNKLIIVNLSDRNAVREYIRDEKTGGNST